MELFRRLGEELYHGGFTARSVSTVHISELANEITTLREQKFLDEQICQKYLSHCLNFDYQKTMPEAKTVFIIAHPQRVTPLYFEYQGKNHRVIIPPTYPSHELKSKLERLLNQVLMPVGYRFQSTRLPEKLLAVRTGLGVYGRNNICYIHGMGSFHRLFSFYTDMPCDEDHWIEKAAMAECSHCQACIKACPTHCITGDRFLIHAEKCLTAMNEQKEEFPGWLDPSCHNAIVGCMKCQAVCPKNQEFINQNETEIIFCSKETESILAQTPFDRLPSKMQEKLEKIGLAEYYHVMPRNLNVLIKSNAGAN